MTAPVLHTKYTPVNPQPGDMPHKVIAEREVARAKAESS